jgi:arylsulfatase A-like enzyme
MLLPRLAGRRRAVAAAAAAAALWAACAGVVLARDHGDAWLVWSETGASRYLTRRWTALTPAADPSVAGDRMVVKPALESERTEALRAERAAAPAPDIVIFSVDGLRRDKVGAFGSRRGLTPNIDRMAARGVRFTRAVSSFPLTQVFNSDLLLGRYVDRVGPVQQPPGFRPLAITNLLKRRDYHLFVKSWFEMSNRNRFDPRPYQMDTYVRKAASAEDLEESMESAMARIAAHLAEARERGRPVFLWMHLLTTHPMTGKGFVPHPDYDFGDSRMERYESAVAGTDRWLKGVEDLMATRSDRPVIWIICSDHGVNVTTYSRDLHEPVLRVPFVLVAPGVAPRDDDHLVDVALDLAATVVDLAGVPPPPEYDGVSLVPLLAGLPADAMAERLIPLSYVGGWSGAVHGRFKYLRRADVMSLFDVVADPEEKHNLIGAEFERALAMRAVADRELERRFRDAAEARGDGP